MKYYLVTTYTCYCGEHFYHYVAIPEDESISDEKWADLFYGWVCDDAAGYAMMLPSGGMISLRKSMTLMMITSASAVMMWKKSLRLSILLTAERSKV